MEERFKLRDIIWVKGQVTQEDSDKKAYIAMPYIVNLNKTKTKNALTGDIKKMPWFAAFSSKYDKYAKHHFEETYNCDKAEVLEDFELEYNIGTDPKKSSYLQYVKLQNPKDIYKFIGLDTILDREGIQCICNDIANFSNRKLAYNKNMEDLQQSIDSARTF